VRAARLHGPRDVRIEEVPAPEPAAGEVLLRVRAVSICGSDCRMYWDGHAGGVIPDHPMIQGHEFAGDVVALGEGVTRPPVGTRVAVDPSWECGHCDMCERGLPNLCRHIVFPSFPQRDGALAEYIACPARATYPIPDSVSYVEGALIEPLGVGLHAVRLADPQPSDRLCILGAGAIGVSVLLCAQLRGVGEIAVFEPVAGRRESARRLGALTPGPSPRGRGETAYEADIVFECAGEGAAIEEALYLARPAGKVVVVGIPHPERISFEAQIARRKELTVIFTRRSRDTLGECVELVASGRIDLKAFPIRTYPLEAAAEAIEATAARPGDMVRAVVLP
jgi:L-iditol 2-dehydrogenase